MELSSPLSPEFQASQWYPKEPGYQPSSSPLPEPITTVQKTKSSGNHLKQFIPMMSSRMAKCCAVANVLLPGSGTCISALALKFNKARLVDVQNQTEDEIFKMNVYIAVLQLLTTAVFGFGWIWSIMWSLEFVQLSGRPQYLGSEATTPTTRELPMFILTATPVVYTLDPGSRSSSIGEVLAPVLDESRDCSSRVGEEGSAPGPAPTHRHHAHRHHYGHNHHQQRLQRRRFEAGIAASGLQNLVLTPQILSTLCVTEEPRPRAYVK